MTVGSDTSAITVNSLIGSMPPILSRTGCARESGVVESFEAVEE